MTDLDKTEESAQGFSGTDAKHECCECAERLRVEIQFVRSLTPPEAYNTRVAADVVNRDTTIATLREALELILPMAKGYAAANPVGSNAHHIETADMALAPTEAPQ